MKYAPKITRDLILFIAGLCLILYESIFRAGEPRTALIALYAAMIGLPFVLRHDESKRKNGKDDDGKE